MNRFHRTPRNFSPLVRRVKSKEAADSDDDLDGSDGDKEVSLKTTFELNDTLYAEAELEDTDQVYLWLGVSSVLILFVLETEPIPSRE